MFLDGWLPEQDVAGADVISCAEGEAAPTLGVLQRC